LPLPRYPALRVLRRDRGGSSSPIIVETRAGRFLVKLRGAAQGPAVLVAEVIVGAIADFLGLAVPSRAVIELASTTPTDDANDELADLLRASWGDNLGFAFLDQAHPIHPTELAFVDRDWATQVRWLDWLVLNPDRTPSSPNLLAHGRRGWLIDHGAALHFHYDWAAVAEQSPLRPEPPGHLLSPWANKLEEWDPILTGQFGREDLERAVATVPESFLIPLLPPPVTPEHLARRRAAYVAFLWKRLKGPHSFAGARAVAAS
jgi:hypothetical protein